MVAARLGDCPGTRRPQTAARWRLAGAGREVLTIADDYELAAGEGVEFYWHTRLPVSVAGNHAVIAGARGRVDLEGPEGCVWRLDKLPLLDGLQHRLALHVPGTVGTVTVEVRLAGTPAFAVGNH